MPNAPSGHGRAASPRRGPFSPGSPHPNDPPPPGPDPVRPPPGAGPPPRPGPGSAGRPRSGPLRRGGPAKVRAMPDLRLREILVVAPLIALLIGLGVYPKPLTEIVD
ncbi:hypothetical protein E6R62_37175, partial [Streptomyces sp. A1136]